MLSDFQKTSTFIILIIVNLSISSSINIHLPSVPLIQASLHATDVQMQLIMALFIIGSTISRLFLGVFSDYLGRKKLLIITLIIQIIALFYCALSTTIEEFLFFKVLHSIGAGVNTIAGVAIIADIFTGNKRVQALGLIELTLPIGFMLGPIIGGYISNFYKDWQMQFYILGVLYIFALVLTVFGIKETLKERRVFGLKQVIGDYHLVAKNQEFVTYAIILSLFISTSLVFTISSPFILMQEYGLNELQYANCLIISIFGNICSMILFRYTVTKFEVEKCLKYSVMGLFFVLLIYIFIALKITNISVYLIIFSITLLNVLMGHATPCLVALAINLFPNNRGVASSVMGFLRTFIPGILLFVIALTHAPQLNTTFWIMSFLIVITLLIYYLKFKASVE